MIRFNRREALKRLGGGGSAAAAVMLGRDAFWENLAGPSPWSTRRASRAEGFRR